MIEYDVDIKFGIEPVMTEQVAAIIKMYGADTEKLKTAAVEHKCRIKLNDADICFITGASGAGKSAILNEMYNQTPRQSRIYLDYNRRHKIREHRQKTVVENIDNEPLAAIRKLNTAGICDLTSTLNSPDKLSDGQWYRYQLAKVLAEPKKVVFADDFCSGLDRITASVVAGHIRKYAKKTKTIFVLATSHDDLVCDLRPEVVVIAKQNRCDAEVVYRDTSVSMLRK